MVNWMAKKSSLHCSTFPCSLGLDSLSRIKCATADTGQWAGKHSDVAGQRKKCESALPGHQVAALPTIWLSSALCWHQEAAPPTIWLPSGFWRAVERKGLNSPKRNSRLCALELLAIKRTVCSYLKHSYIYYLFKGNLCPEKLWRVQDLSYIFKYFILKEGKQINELYRRLLAEPGSSQVSWPLVSKADTVAHESIIVFAFKFWWSQPQHLGKRGRRAATSSRLIWDRESVPGQGYKAPAAPTHTENQ